MYVFIRDAGVRITKNPFLDPRAIRRNYRYIMQYKGSNKISIVKYGRINVSYLPQLDGGGRDFGQDYIPITKNKLGKIGRACEFGCGPGFIGFSLLAHGLCDSLCLIDVNPKAVNIVKRTIRENGLQDKVKVYLSDGLKKIPRTEKWDLVVSNPPHFGGTDKEYYSDLRIYDPKWHIHEAFYKNIKGFLNKDGSVMFVENAMGSTPGQWKKMMEKNGLHYISAFKVSKHHGVIRQIKAVYHTMQRVDRSSMIKQTGGTARTIASMPRNMYYVYNYVMNDPFYFVWAKK